ncbi:DMT family transporter [Paenibacillus dauci]|uniref:DMT family transporter n=1 Tax=Paenibacillus dauci TaxID=1567106 RepID=UPI0009E1F9AE|nr:DMT family transporter [Paenibacillus dauci]
MDEYSSGGGTGSHSSDSGHAQPLHKMMVSGSSILVGAYKTGKSGGTAPRKTLLLLLFLVMVWGINWPLTKLALPEVPPILFSGLRTLIGGVLLLFIAMRHREKLQWKQNWPVYTVLAIFNIIGYYGLQTVGIGYLPAGLFSTIVFLQPVLLSLFAWLWLGESMSVLKVVGLLFGFAGVAVISSGGLEGNLSPLGIGLAVASALCWAIGTIYMKKKSAQLDSLWTVTVQLLIGGIVLSVIGSGTESWSDIHWTPSFIGILLFISVFVIAAGWLVYFKLMDSGEASTVGSYTFAIPVIANIFSVILLGESVTLPLLIGLVMIAVGIGLVNRKRTIVVPVKQTCNNRS